MTTPVPGPPASVLSSILVQNPDDTTGGLMSVAVFSSSGEAPYLPSLANDVVAMPKDALADANFSTTGFLSTLGLTGATAPTRWVGATFSGAPASGTFLAGDFVIDQTGLVWVCKTAGSPGTWGVPTGAPSGAASGDLSGSYPGPAVGKYAGTAVVPPSGDSTGTTDTAAIQAVLSAGLPCQLAAAVYYLKQPLIPSASTARIWLRGTKGAVQGVGGTASQAGTCLRLVSGFSNPGAAPVNAAFCVYNVGNKDSGVTSNLALDLRDVFIDGSANGGAADAIGLYGPMAGAAVERVGFYQVGNCFNNVKDSGGNPPTAHMVRDCVSNACKGWGLIQVGNDSTFTNWHTQACLSGGFWVQGSHNQFVNCRPDMSGFTTASVPSGNNAPGFLFDAFGPAGGFLDANMVIGGSSQRNDGPAIRVTNTSATGTSPRIPVLISGFNCGGDWVNGGAGAAAKGAIHAEGSNEVFISHGSVTVHTEDVAGGCPDYGLSTAKIGTSSAAPKYAEWASGFVNAVVGVVNDAAAVSPSFGPAVAASTGAQYSGGAVSQPFSQNTALLMGGYLAQSADNNSISGTGVALGAAGTAGAGVLNLIKLPLYGQSLTTTGVALYLITAGATLTTGENYAFLYTSSGTFAAATADQTANWGGTAGLLTPAWAGGPFTISGPFCWVALVYNGTTGPSFLRGSVLSNVFANGRNAVSTAQHGSVLSGITTSTPGNFTPASITFASATLWAAIY